MIAEELRTVPDAVLVGRLQVAGQRKPALEEMHLVAGSSRVVERFQEPGIVVGEFSAQQFTGNGLVRSTSFSGRRLPRDPVDRRTRKPVNPIFAWTVF